MLEECDWVYVVLIITVYKQLNTIYKQLGLLSWLCLIINNNNNNDDDDDDDDDDDNNNNNNNNNTTPNSPDQLGT